MFIFRMMLIVCFAALGLSTKAQILKFDELRNIYIDSASNLPFNGGSTYEDPFGNKTTNYFSEGKNTSSVVESPVSGDKTIISNNDSGDNFEYIHLDSLFNLKSFFLSMPNASVDIKMNELSNSPSRIITRIKDEVTLFYPQENSAKNKYQFELNNPNLMEWDAFQSDSTRYYTMLQSQNYLKNKYKIDKLIYNFFNKLCLYEVGPRDIYLISDTKKENLLERWFFKDGIVIKEERYLNGKLINTEVYED